MSQPLVEPQRVVLSSADWVDELAGELIRLGHDRGQARRSAVTILRRILARSEWPGDHFVVEDEPPQF